MIGGTERLLKARRAVSADQQEVDLRGPVADEWEPTAREGQS
jgi:hypothetical protein